MKIDELDAAIDELLLDGWNSVAEYILSKAKYGYWNREIFQNGDQFKAFDVYYNDGVEDFEGPFDVVQKQTITYEKV